MSSKTSSMPQERTLVATVRHALEDQAGYLSTLYDDVPAYRKRLAALDALTALAERAEEVERLLDDAISRFSDERAQRKAFERCLRRIAGTSKTWEGIMARESLASTEEPRG